MNFIFISPNFPKSYWNFCDRLKKRGVNVLGIGDAPYDELPFSLKNSLTEYYRVENLAHYDEMFRAVAFFSFRYGKIDWLESNNEYWLAQDARLRTDFNITTGVQNDFIHRIQSKYAMKESYRKAGVPVARCHMVTRNRKASEAFISEVGWPVIVKPDRGCGAEATYKLTDGAGLDEFYRHYPAVPYIMEEFISGSIVSFDGVAGADCVPVFYTSNEFPTPILDIVAQSGDLHYWTVPVVDEKLRDVGFRTIAAFGAKCRFFHCEFFRLDQDKPGLGKKGDYVALEVNMRPAGGYTPDMINYANSADCYGIWADMITGRAPEAQPALPHYFCVYAARRDGKDYRWSHNDILGRYGRAIVMADRMPKALSLDMGDQMYTACFETAAEKDAFIAYVQELAPATPPPQAPRTRRTARNAPAKKTASAEPAEIQPPKNSKRRERAK